MLSSWDLPIKSITYAPGYIYIVSYDAKEKEQKDLQNCYRKIIRSKKLTERIICRWQGYYCHDCSEETPEEFVLSVFALTKRRLYVAYELFSETHLSVLKIGKDSFYDLNESFDYELTSFALCSGQVMYCLYDKSESLTKRLKQIMRRIGVPTLKGTLDNLLEKIVL